MISRILLSSTLVLAITTTAARASEGGEGSLFGGDIGNAVWTLVIFFLVLFVLGKFAWGPLLQGLQQREEFIRDSLEGARKDREEAAAQLQEYSAKLDAARGEASGLVEEARRAGEGVKTRLEQDARDEAEKIVERARREIELAKKAAIKDLYAAGAELATSVASKVLEREVSPQDHERLIAESIDRLGNLDQN